MTITTRSFWLTVNEDNGTMGITLSAIDRHYQRAESTSKEGTRAEVRVWLHAVLDRMLEHKDIRTGKETP